MAITVPTAGTELTVTAFGKPVADAVNANTAAVTPTAWTGATFQNGYGNYGSGYQTVQYRKLGDNVQIRGLLAHGGTPGVNGNAFALPVGYRPAQSLLMGVSTDGAAKLQRVDISNDGSVVIVSPAADCSYWNMVFSFSTTA